MGLFRDSNTWGVRNTSPAPYPLGHAASACGWQFTCLLYTKKNQSPYLRQCQLKYKKFKILNDLQIRRLNKRDLEYAALEDEFRMGLQIEANRFREVGHDFEKHFYQFFLSKI